MHDALRRFLFLSSYLSSKSKAPHYAKIVQSPKKKIKVLEVGRRIKLGLLRSRQLQVTKQRGEKKKVGGAHGCDIGRQWRRDY